MNFFPYTASEIVSTMTRDESGPARHTMTIDGVVEVVDDRWEDTFEGLKMVVANDRKSGRSGLIITDAAGASQGLALTAETSLDYAASLLGTHTLSRRYMKNLARVVRDHDHIYAPADEVAAAIIAAVRQLRKDVPLQARVDGTAWYANTFRIEDSEISPTAAQAARDLLIEFGVIRRVERKLGRDVGIDTDVEILYLNPVKLASWVIVPVEMDEVEQPENFWPEDFELDCNPAIEPRIPGF